MSALTRLESWLQAAVEGPARWLTGQRVQPVEIARRLVVAMDDAILVTGDRPLAPNRYEVTVAEADHAAMAGIVDALQREFERFVETEASGRGYRLAGAPRVVIGVAAGHPSGRATVVATHEAPPPGEAPGATRVMPVVEARPASGRVPAPVAGSLTLSALDGATWQVARGTRLDVGRDRACHVVLEDGSVSRRHATVAWTEVASTGPALEIEDLDSTNGTVVDGRRVRHAVVRPGGLVQFGDVSMRVGEGDRS